MNPMAGLNETPGANRVHVAFFGLRNAGKSTLVNEFTSQQLAIVSDVAGTTTDPVSKAMEILPLGPCVVTDTAGLDDVGELGAQRVKKSLDVLATTDIAVWVWACGAAEKVPDARFDAFMQECRKRNVTVFEYFRGDSTSELKAKIAAVRLEDKMPGLLDGIVKQGDRVVCVVPIDESAPKGRLILPQQQVIRECLEIGAVCTVCQPDMLGACLAGQDLVITDSQAFGEVRATIERFGSVRLTSFSILFARQKGDLAEYMRGLEALKSLNDGDTVLIAEGCTHHRQCNDIGAVKIRKAVKKLTGKELNFTFSSGMSFPLTASPALVIHCGGCMLTRREVQRRIGVAKECGIPIVNYGMVLAAANGIGIGDITA